MKKVFLFLLMTFILASCNNTNNIKEKIDSSWDEKVEKIKITTSIIPLASIANYIGWDFVEAQSLVPAWISPHWFDVKPNQMIDIEKSDLIIYLDLDHVDWFINKVIDWKTNIVTVKKGIELLEPIQHDHHDEHEEDEYHEDHETEEHDEHNDKEDYSTDPHIWGSSENAYLIANTILNELIKISPKNKNYFNSNLESFKNELDKAKNNFEENINWKVGANFIAFHDAYNYLFAELNIDNSKKHIFRKNILSNPNSNEMKELIDEIKHLQIKVAFKEPQLDSSNLKKVASDYNLGIYILDPIWSDDSENWYIDNYKNNLDSLEKIYE